MGIRDFFFPSKVAPPPRSGAVPVDVPSTSNPLDDLCAELGEGWTYARTTEETSEGRVVILIMKNRSGHESFSARAATTKDALELLRTRAEGYRHA